jgi:hypothetical protein
MGDAFIGSYSGRTCIQNQENKRDRAEEGCGFRLKSSLGCPLGELPLLKRGTCSIVSQSLAKT